MYTSAQLNRNQRNAQTYASVGLETEVLSASPEKLITLLFKAAIAALTCAKRHNSPADLANRRVSIDKALRIINNGLLAAIDEAQGEVARLFVTSYRLMIHHLMLANLRKNDAHIDIVLEMLKDLSGAWSEATRSV